MHKIGIKELVDMLRKEKAQCEDTLRICKESVEKSLEPRSVWLQEKGKVENRIKEIDRSLELLEKYL